MAQACVKVGAEGMSALKEGRVPKGDVIETAKTAAYFAVKNTAHALPHCHPIPVDHTHVSITLANNDTVVLEVTVKSVGKTGCEMEALHGASVAALTVYDMLKPIEKNMEILSVRLLEKTGGKSDYKDTFSASLTAAVIVMSDSIHAGKKTDRAGKAIADKLKASGVEVIHYCIIPDEPAELKKKLKETAGMGAAMAITTGGTGLSPRDITPETLRPLLDREIPGIMEAARSYGQRRTPYAMLSRGLAGMMGNMLVLALPGSTRGAAESMAALFPHILHLYKTVNPSYKHEKTGNRAASKSKIINQKS